MLLPMGENFRLEIPNYNNMDVNIYIEWSYELGFDAFNVLDFTERIDKSFVDKYYGSSVGSIGAILICRPQDFKQRMRFLKGERRLTYDILLDFESVKNAPIDEKKEIIKRRIVEISEQTFSKYKFDDFDKEAFLRDLKKIVESIKW
jgi:hypothetical protein